MKEYTIVSGSYRILWYLRILWHLVKVWVCAPCQKWKRIQVRCTRNRMLFIVWWVRVERFKKYWKVTESESTCVRNEFQQKNLKLLRSTLVCYNFTAHTRTRTRLKWWHIETLKALDESLTLNYETKKCYRFSMSRGNVRVRIKNKKKCVS